jgi:hypothetical protein
VFSFVLSQRRRWCGVVACIGTVDGSESFASGHR